MQFQEHAADQLPSTPRRKCASSRNSACSAGRRPWRTAPIHGWQRCRVGPRLPLLHGARFVHHILPRCTTDFRTVSCSVFWTLPCSAGKTLAVPTCPRGITAGWMTGFGTGRGQGSASSRISRSRHNPAQGADRQRGSAMENPYFVSVTTNRYVQHAKTQLDSGSVGNKPDTMRVTATAPALTTLHWRSHTWPQAQKKQHLQPKQPRQQKKSRRKKRRDQPL